MVCKISDEVRALVSRRLQRSMELKAALLDDTAYQDSTVDIAMRIVESLERGGKVFFFGNGGSAADAQHLAAEFTGRYLKERRALPAIALNANTSSLTGIGNDYGFDQVFARQIEALGRDGDVAVGISTSGNSCNVIQALTAARAKGMFCVAFTGASGTRIESVADCTIRIPSTETPRIQECHILTGHIICEIVEETLFGNSPGD
jgi:D-sedoheptulose 7-phosphate isomerase